MWKGQPEVWVRAGGYFTPFGHSLFLNRRKYFPIAISTSQLHKWFLGDENVQLSIAFVPFPDLTSYLKNKTPTHICWQKKPSAHFWQCSFYCGSFPFPFHIYFAQTNPFILTVWLRSKFKCDIPFYLSRSQLVCQVMSNADSLFSSWFKLTFYL